MVKAGIVTLYHGTLNYGGTLQAFALQKKIAELGILCEVIDSKNIHHHGKLGYMLTIGYKRASEVLYRKAAYQIKLFTDRNVKRGIERRKAKFLAFQNSIPHSVRVTSRDMQLVESSYDFYVTGSDQVWNPELWNTAFLLSFVKQGKKISYAASVGVSRLNENQKKELQTALESYSAISVREAGAKRIITELTSLKVEVVLDPTFLFDSRIWSNLMEPVPLHEDEPYAFFYTVGDGSAHRKRVYEYCKKHGLKLVTIPYTQAHYRRADEKYTDLALLDVGPGQWLKLIEGAEIVFTDSFHGTAFSINFHKNFWSYENSIGIQENDTLRIHSLLKQLGLEKRVLNYDDELTDERVREKIDYTDPDIKLAELRSQSVLYLKKNLS